MQRIARSSASFAALFCCTASPAAARPRSICISSRDVLERGGQALVLVPEISLTPQLEARFRHAFPEARLALMHSGLEDIARTTRMARRPRAARPAIVLGTRLAVLAPLPKLGLIVVDEEHDASFKQQEGLRYSARDAAVYRAKLAGCPVVLGTATPSLETWHNWRQGRYERLEISRARRARRAPAGRARASTCDPSSIDARLHRDAARGDRRSGCERGEQSLVFINRRGYAPVLACEACGWTAGCQRCTRAWCCTAADRRACAATTAAPTDRDAARLPDLRQRRSASRWAAARSASRKRSPARFPGARIVRIDRDSARRRGELARTLGGHAARRGRHPGRHAAARQGPRLPQSHAGRRAERRHRARLDRLPRRRAPVRRAGAGRGPRRAARASGRSAGADALSRPSALRRARAARLRRLRRVAARRAPQRRLPAVRVRGRAARRGDEARHARCISCASARRAGRRAGRASASSTRCPTS